MKKKQPEQVKKNKQRKKISKKWLILNICLALVFFAIIVAIYFLTNNNNSSKSNSDNGVKTVSNSTKKASTDAMKLVQSGDTESAAKVYSEAVKNTSSNDEKISLLISKAAIYFDNDDFDNALSSAKEALAIKETFGVDDFLGKIYYENGDLENAIIYYQKAMNLLDKNSLTYKSDLADYQKIIDDAKKEASNE